MTELFHGIRSQLTTLLDGLDPKDLATMNLGLSHSLSRFVPGSPRKMLKHILILEQLQVEVLSG